MQRELLRILTSIKEKTGIDVIVESFNGEYEISTINDYINLNFNKNATNDKELKVDKEDNKTYFSFTFNDVKFVGAIIGDSEVEKNYAMFIGSYIENSQTKNTGLTYDEQLLSIISGQTTKVKISRFIDKYSISSHACYVVLFKNENKKSNEVCEFLNNYGTESGDSSLIIDENTTAFLKFINADIDGDEISPAEYSEYIVRAIYEELGIEVRGYIGGVVNNFYDVSISLKQAYAVEEVVRLYKNQNLINAYKDFVLNKMIEDLPAFKQSEYLSVLLENYSEEVFLDSELMDTAFEFLNNDLNISETARAMFLHRNTLLYRIEKIQKLTGLDIRKFNDALNFKLIISLKGIVK